MLKSPLLALFILIYSAVAQVAPPQHESRWHHVLTRHRDIENYQQRFDDIKCALVLIRRPGAAGTGVFISADGDIATASHVLADRSFKSHPDGTYETGLVNMPAFFTVTDCHGNSTEVPNAKVETNGDAWGVDLAMLQSGIHADCWLAIAPNGAPHPGEPLITMGFPGLAWGSLAIYTGIVSTPTLKLDLVVGFSETQQPIRQLNEFIQVQMPISAGISGSPIIDQDNRVIGIVTMAGASTPEIDLLIQLNHQNFFAGPPPAVAPPPGQRQVNLNPFALVAQLAENLKNFASPGYGDAVPIKYLRKAQPRNPKPESPGH
jgi:S1-C subfamily serine protease